MKQSVMKGEVLRLAQAIWPGRDYYLQWLMRQLFDRYNCSGNARDIVEAVDTEIRRLQKLRAEIVALRSDVWRAT